MESAAARGHLQAVSAPESSAGEAPSAAARAAAAVGVGNDAVPGPAAGGEGPLLPARSSSCGCGGGFAFSDGVGRLRGPPLRSAEDASLGG